MPPLGVVVRYVVLVVLWGSTWAAIRIGVSSVPPFVFALERAIAVSLILTVAALLMGMRFPTDRRTIVAAGIAGIVNTGSSWAIIFWSEQYVPSGLVSVFGAAGPIWTAVAAHFLVHGDRLSRGKILGLILGIAGVVVLVGAPDTGGRPEAIVATVLLALMPITWAVGAIAQVRALKHGAAIPLVAVGSWAGALVLVPFGLAQAGTPATWTFDVAAAFVYLVVFGSCVGLVLQLWLIRRLRPTTVSLAQLPISALALTVGAVALGESVTWRMLGGAALVGVALVLNAFAGGRPAEEYATATPAD